MALIYKSASLLSTLSLGLLTIFGFVSLFFISAPKLWTGSGGLFETDIAHAETPTSCTCQSDSCGCGSCACSCSCSGCSGCACDCGSGCSSGSCSSCGW